MSIDVKDEIDTLKKKASEAEKSEDALRFSQAAVNLANARACMANTDKEAKS